MQPSAITTVLLSVLLSLACAAGAVLVLGGVLFDSAQPPPARDATAQETGKQQRPANSTQPASTEAFSNEAELQRRVTELERKLTAYFETHQESTEALHREIRRLRAELAAGASPGALPRVEGEEAEGASENAVAWAESPQAAAALLELPEFEQALQASVERIEQQRRNAEIERRLAGLEEYRQRVYAEFLETVTEQVALSPRQQGSVRTALDARGEALGRLYDPRVPAEERGNRGEINRRFDEQVRGILTPQQHQIYEENRLGDMRRYGTNRRGPSPSGSSD